MLTKDFARLIVVQLEQSINFKKYDLQCVLEKSSIFLKVKEYGWPPTLVKEHS